jgi:hypothetical protein
LSSTKSSLVDTKCIQQVTCMNLCHGTALNPHLLEAAKLASQAVDLSIEIKLVAGVDTDLQLI